MLDSPGWTETAYRRLEEAENSEHHALVRVFQLPGGFRLLVGRDLEERERLYDIVICRRALVDRDRGRARPRRRVLRHPPRAASASTP